MISVPVSGPIAVYRSHLRGRRRFVSIHGFIIIIIMVDLRPRGEGLKTKKCCRGRNWPGGAIFFLSVVATASTNIHCNGASTGNDGKVIGSNGPKLLRLDSRCG